MRKTTLAILGLLVGAGVVTACTTESTTAAPSTSPNDGGADASVTCSGEPSGNGTINITITGLPDGVKIDPSSQIVHFKGKTQHAGAAITTLLAAPADQYEASADIQYASDPTVRTAYAATITPSSFCLGNGQSQNVSVTYAPVPSSNKLWTTNNSPSGQVLGFASSTLGATGTPAASVAVKSGAGTAIAFDAEGNMWTLAGTVADPPIQRYAASTLGASGEKTPDRSLTLDPGCLPGLTSLAFSPTGELYVSSACGQKISRVATADLAASGTPTPNLTLGGLGAPEGIAFDKSGNLWVADSGTKTIARFDAARLATSSTDPANLVITPKTPAEGDLAPTYLAFAGNGDLWASSFGGNVLYRLTATDQAGTGPKNVTPAVQLTLPVDALIEGLAFDEAGALWVTLSTGKIGRVSPAQLATSTTAGAPTIPEVIVTSADIGNAQSLAFYPPASFSPIYGH
jgi:hypothetical protein